MRSASGRSLIVYIHPPKTAGCTVNAYLEKSSQSGAAHIDEWISFDPAISAKIRSLDWVSGHIPLTEMVSLLNFQTGRPLRLFTLVRDPVKQLISHYNWMIEIFERGYAFYDRHPQWIKDISVAVRSADNGDPASVAEQIATASDFFLNIQSQFVLGKTHETCFSHDWVERLAIYECIGDDNSLPQFVEQISGIPHTGQIQENESTYHFDKEVFYDSFLREFIEENHAVDLALYRYITDREKPS